MQINDIRKTKLNNTLIIRDDNDTAVIFQETPIVTFNEDSIILDCGGWWTRTTQSRMNWASREYALAYRVFCKAGEWFVNYQGTIHSFDSEQIQMKREPKRAQVRD